MTSRSRGPDMPAGYGSVLHRSSSPRRPAGESLRSASSPTAAGGGGSASASTSATGRRAIRAGWDAAAGSATPPTTPQPQATAEASGADLLADFRKGYGAEKRYAASTSAALAQTVSAASGAAHTLAELQSVKAQLAAHMAAYDRLGFASFPGGIEGVAHSLADATMQSAELRHALSATREELRGTREELHVASRQLAQIEELDRKRFGRELSAESERGESSARRAALLARITTLRGVSETLLSLLDQARRRLHKAGAAGGGEAASGVEDGKPPSPLKSPSETWKRAESLVSDALSTLRSLASEQESVARDMVSMGRLLPPDEALADMARQVAVHKAREEDAKLAAELAGEGRDAAREDLGVKVAAAGQALSTVSAKLSEQITRAENLQQQLSAERSRGAGLENALTACQASVSTLQAEKVALLMRLRDVDEKLAGATARVGVAEAGERAAQDKAEELQTTVTILQREAELLQRTLALSEVQRAQAEGRTEAATTLAARADLGCIEARSEKVSLQTKHGELQVAYRELQGVVEAERARRRALEGQIADLARKPGALGGGSSRSASPAHARAFGVEEPLRPAASSARAGAAEEGGGGSDA